MVNTIEHCSSLVSMWIDENTKVSSPKLHKLLQLSSTSKLYLQLMEIKAFISNNSEIKGHKVRNFTTKRLHAKSSMLSKRKWNDFHRIPLLQPYTTVKLSTLFKPNWRPKQHDYILGHRNFQLNTTTFTFPIANYTADFLESVQFTQMTYDEKDFKKGTKFCIKKRPTVVCANHSQKTLQWFLQAVEKEDEVGQ